MVLGFQTEGDAIVGGNLKVGTFSSPAASVNNAAIEANAKVEYSKIEQGRCFSWVLPRRNVPFKIFSPTQNIDNGSSTTVDRALRHFKKAGRILGLRVVNDTEAAGTVNAATAKIGVTSNGEEVVAEVGYTNSAAVGAAQELTLVDPVIAAGETLLWRHTGIAATVAGEVHIEGEAVEFDGTVYDCEQQIHSVYGVDGAVTSVAVSALTAPTGGDRACTVDVQKWNGSTWASVLTSPITIDSTVSNNEVVTDIPTSGTLAAGNKLKIVVATSGTTGTNALDLVVDVFVAEKPLTT